MPPKVNNGAALTHPDFVTLVDPLFRKRERGLFFYLFYPLYAKGEERVVKRSDDRVSFYSYCATACYSFTSTLGFGFKNVIAIPTSNITLPVISCSDKFSFSINTANMPATTV